MVNRVPVFEMNEKPDLQPTLVGPMVKIRPLKTSDWDDLFVAAADPKIWEVHPALDRYQEPVFRAYFEGAVISGSAFTFVDQATGKVFGSSRYYGYDPETNEVEIGWTFITRDYWGGSYNSEIKGLLLAHAFTFVDTVVFWVGEDNIRSRRAMEKIGGQLRPGLHVREESGADPHVIYEIRKPS